MADTGSKISKTGLLLTAGALFAVALSALPAGAGFAQNSPDMTQLMNRLGQIENQLQTLSRSVYRGAPPPQMDAAPMAAPADASAVASFETRLSQIEQQQRQMTGQIEEATWRIQQVQDSLDRLQRDLEARLTQLEHGGAPAAAGASDYSSGASGGGASGAAQDGAVAVGSPYMDTTLPQKTLGSISSSGGGTPDALYESAFADIREAKYAEAEAKFLDFTANHPNHPLAANAQYWLGESYYVRGNYEQAAKVFAQGYQDYPKSSKSADSLLKLGLSLGKLGRKDDACLSFEQLRKEFPGDTVPANRRAVQEMQKTGC